MMCQPLFSLGFLEGDPLLRTAGPPRSFQPVPLAPPSPLTGSAQPVLRLRPAGFPGPASPIALVAEIDITKL